MLFLHGLGECSAYCTLGMLPTYTLPPLIVAHPVLSEIILCLVLCIIIYSYSRSYCGGMHWLTANRYLYMYWLFLCCAGCGPLAILL